MAKILPINNIIQTLDMGVNAYKYIESTQMNSYGTSNREAFIKQFPAGDYQIGSNSYNQDNPNLFMFGNTGFGSKSFKVSE